jgi:copper(I)-binding protein
MTTQAKVQCLIANRTEAMELSVEDFALGPRDPIRGSRTGVGRLVHRLALALAAVAIGMASGIAAAHDYRAGDVRVRHPFATPTPPGARIGAAYFAALENRGTQVDRLVRASTPAAARVELHSGDIGSDGVMRMREKESIDVPAKTTVKLRPGGGDHLMLMQLKKPLLEGDTFPMTLEFERGGKVEVNVVVQVPKAGVGGRAADHGSHDAGGHGSAHAPGGRAH